MSNIRNKISSIEADDDVVSKALGLRPADDDDILKPVEVLAEDKIEPIEPVQEKKPKKTSSHWAMPGTADCWRKSFGTDGPMC